MIRYSGGDGTCKSNTIKITGARINVEGVDAEYALIRSVFQILHKKWELLFQELISDDKHSYDRLVLKDEDGNVGEIWFDIMDFFGKW
ncbi:MAG: hypothetical protein WDA75_19615 [Candidatus Latescibacterota bacterium]|jgi:hypothetical protein|nr:hypothetical protein [Ignavibacteriaceae bacterium]